MELVIARYKEDTSWIKNITRAKKTTLYNKFYDETIKLPNVGRESHSYLYHIVNNYSTLEDYTTFLQGNPFDHEPNITQLINDTKLENNNLYFGRTIKISSKTLPINYLLNLLFDIEIHYKIRFYCGAQFIITKESIRSKPKDFYVFLLKLVSYHINPIEAYIFEVIWPYIFNKDIQIGEKCKSLM